MIRIQRLKEPKKGKSGKEIEPGKTLIFKGVEITNISTHSFFVSYWQRPGKDLINRKKKSKAINKKLAKGPVK